MKVIVSSTGNSVEAVSNFLASLQPDISYLAVPSRPPAEKRVQPPGEEVVNRAYQQLSRKQNLVEFLVGYEGNAFASSGNAREDLLVSRRFIRCEEGDRQEGKGSLQYPLEDRP